MVTADDNEEPSCFAPIESGRLALPVTEYIPAVQLWATGSNSQLHAAP